MTEYHKYCGGIIVFFSSFTEKQDIEIPICSKCGSTGKAIRTDIK
jgi:hypothetical protein